jgi:uncharacterized protein YprB with RNaseH-like and TPR domain
MLTSTFCHLPGVGLRTEARLWSAGFVSWDCLLTAAKTRAHRVRPSWLAHLQASREHHREGDPAYFADRLPAHSHWRLFADYRDTAAFLDIETTGMGSADVITTIALFDGRRIRHYVRGHNLDDFLRDVRECRLLVTYNGRSFDVPFIERHFRTRLPQAHIDLRHVLQSLGVTGGLKACERKLGVMRPGLEDVDGFVGVLLWHHYRRTGDRRALETLLAYNIADAVNLEPLMVMAYNARLRQTPFADIRSLPLPRSPVPPFQPDRGTLGRVLASVAAAGR